MYDSKPYYYGTGRRKNSVARVRVYDNGTGKTQHTLSAAERHKNVEQFSAAPVSLEGMRVLLCDDVLTTGSTMNRCAALLKAQGAAEVAAISMTTTAMKSPSKEPTHG